MTALVIGASDQAIRRLREIAPRGVDIVSEPVAEADWILVASMPQRIEAMSARRMPAFRVLEWPEIASNLDSATADALRAALVKMAEIGAVRPLLSSLGFAIVRPFVRGSTDTAAVAADAGAPDESEDKLTRRLLPRPMPAGARLDEVLREREHKRAERFIELAQQWPAEERTR
jgi:hypothetical protein